MQVLGMPQDSAGNSDKVIWTGKPWILPSVLARTVAIVVFAVVIFWLEFHFGVATNTDLLNLPIMLWMGLVIFLVWIVSIVHLLLLRASNSYILRNDSLEIRVGIFTSKSSMVGASGFSDLEVIRSVSGRLMNLGDIMIRTQGEVNIKMGRVRDPLKVGDQIRGVMARPIVRIEGQEPTSEKK
jgi:uncharacterized membrane protein YdbT with pleckstrin-like domain